MARAFVRAHYGDSQKSYFINVLIIITVIKLGMIASSIWSILKNIQVNPRSRK
jgi:hypothetical protein